MFLSKPFVMNYGMKGAAGLYAILMGFVAILFLIIMIVKIKQDSAKKD
jgi:uncharacterized membrane protein